MSEQPAFHESGATKRRYRTIVADPPWRYRGSMIGFAADRSARSAVPYGTMEIEDIAALPVKDWAEAEAHLYLWTTNTHIEHAWRVARAWGFSYSTLIPWCKAPRGLVGGATFTICTEYVVFARRGSLRSLTRHDRNWFEWPRTQHSAKPEAFLDLVEQTSPGPYLEMFSRRARLGWDTWGDQALHGTELVA